MTEREGQETDLPDESGPGLSAEQISAEDAVQEAFLASIQAWKYARAVVHDAPREMDDAYYDEVRRAVGRGAPSVLLGTSTASLNRSLAQLRAVEQGGAPSG